MIPESEVDKALHYLRTSSETAALAKANAIYLREWVKTVRAQCALKHPGLSQVAADTKALCDPDYMTALEALKCAIEDEATFQFKREAADALIRAYQTQEATRRAEGRAYNG